MKKWTVRCTLIWSINTWHCGMHQKHWKRMEEERMVTWDNGGGQKLNLIQPERNTGNDS